MKPQSGRVLLKAPSIPAGPASSSKVSYLQKTVLAFVSSASCVSRCELGNEIGFPTPAGWDGFGCWALLSPGQTLSDGSAAGARRLRHHVALWNQLDGCRQTGAQPSPLFLRHLYIQRPHTHTQRARHAPSVRTRVQVWGYVSVETVTFSSQKTWSRRWERGTERCVPALSMSIVLSGVTQSFYLIKLVKVIHVFGWFTDPYEHIGASPTAPLGFRKQPRQTAGAGTKCVMGPSNKVSVLIVSIHWFHHLKLELWPYNGEKLGGSSRSDNRSC